MQMYTFYFHNFDLISNQKINKYFRKLQSSQFILYFLHGMTETNHRVVSNKHNKSKKISNNCLFK